MASRYPVFIAIALAVVRPAVRLHEGTVVIGEARGQRSPPLEIGLTSPLSKTWDSATIHNEQR